MIDEIKLDWKMIIDKTIAFYGASKTGKTTLIDDILFLIRDKVKQIIVICPTDGQNNAYSGGRVPRPLIHTNLTEDLLATIIRRQEFLANMYKLANSIANLEKLYRRLNLPIANKEIERIHRKKSEKIAKLHEEYLDIGMRKSKIKEVEEEFEKFFIAFYKKYIEAHKDKFANMELAEDELIALKFLNLNPRIVIVMDDCTADFKKIKTATGKSLLSKIFFQGRWLFITLLLSVHDDKCLDSEFRRSAFLSFFTNDKAATIYFERKENGSKEQLKMVKENIEKGLFANHQKLLFEREGSIFYKYTATLRGEFVFGDPSIVQYCRSIEKNGSVVDKSNEFFQHFINN